MSNYEYDIASDPIMHDPIEINEKNIDFFIRLFEEAENRKEFIVGEPVEYQELTGKAVREFLGDRLCKSK